MVEQLCNENSKYSKFYQVTEDRTAMLISCSWSLTGFWAEPSIAFENEN
jgi:hypothetical protein